MVVSFLNQTPHWSRLSAIWSSEQYRIGYKICKAEYTSFWLEQNQNPNLEKKCGNESVYEIVEAIKLKPKYFRVLVR